jgi:hypothetical protein
VVETNTDPKTLAAGFPMSNAPGAGDVTDG